MHVKCPNCENEFEVSVGAKELEKDTMTFSIKYEGDFLKAKTVGQFIVNCDALLSEVAKAAEYKMHVAFKGFEQRENELLIHFLTMQIKK